VANSLKVCLHKSIGMRRSISDASHRSRTESALGESKEGCEEGARNVAAVPAVKSPAPHGAVAKTAPGKKAVSAKKVGPPKTKTPIAPAP
jgi:hypothetical protein